MIWAQRATFLYALWDLDFEAAEREALLEWNAFYQVWDQHRIAFFRALFPLGEVDRKAFWEHTRLYGPTFERQITLKYPELVADIHLQRAAIHVLEREWVSAGIEAWKSWTLLRKASSKNPLTLQLMGLWQVIFASLPPPYDRFLPELPQSRYEEALRLLRQAANPQNYTTIEAALLHLSVLKNFDTIALQWKDSCLVMLFSEKPPPYLWRFALGLLAWEAGRIAEAEEILTQLTSQPQVQRFPYPLYWLGKLYAFQGSWEEAEKVWQRFVLFQVEPHGLPAQYTWRGLGAWMQGNTTLARRYWEQALTYKPLWDEDVWLQNLASHWLQNPPSPTEIALWKARTSIEVAQYDLARIALEPLLENLYQLPSSEKAQFYYLYGRIYDRIGNVAGAKFAYYQAVRQATAANASLRAYAAYYLGRLYEREADWHNARLSYMEAQDLARSANRSAILQKARAGYWRVEHKRYPVPPEEGSTHR